LPHDKHNAVQYDSDINASDYDLSSSFHFLNANDSLQRLRTRRG
jgi:hypothetical protein